MDLTINGETRSVGEGITVSALVADLGLDLARVVVERNRRIVPREAFGTVELAPGDRVEIVHFVGGG